MKPSSSTIEINGKRYDALTGKLLNVDGVMRPRTHHAKKRHATHKPKSPQKSKTLMREYVNKPKPETTKLQISERSVKPTVMHSVHGRHERAKQIPKSPHISKFGAAGLRKIVTQEPIPVKKPPAHAAMEVSVPSHQPGQLVNQLEQAVEDASSHLEEYVEDRLKFRAGRKFAFALASLGVLLIAGALAFYFVPETKLKVASHQAGFSAELPSYNPAGYSLSGNVVAYPGEVALTYNSRADNGSYKITQTPTSWNSQSLLSNYLISNDKQYQTFESNGVTVYVYENTNATWVNGGIWFKLEGNAPLTTDQLFKIVSSS